MKDNVKKIHVLVLKDKLFLYLKFLCFLLLAADWKAGGKV